MFLQKHMDKILNVQSDVFDMWYKNDEVKSILNAYDIDAKKFLDNHLDSIMNFFVQSINEEKQVKKYQDIKTLLEFLKSYKIKEFEFYILFKCFKNTLKDNLNFSDSDSVKIQNELNEIFENEFAYLLKQYTLNDNNIESKLKHFYSLVNKNIIMSSTDLSGNITHVTDAFCEISGYTREELLGQDHNIVRHPDMPNEIFQDLWNTIQTGETWNSEIKNLKKNGDFYWVSAKILPTFDENNVVIGYDAVRQDITAQKELEEHQEMLAQQSKSAAMGEMISMIAHQWRQPLQAISILVQKLPLTKMLGDEITEELLEQVLEDVNVQIDYMSNTIEDFRDFFKPNKEKNEIEIKKLVSKAIDFLSYMLNIDSIKVNIEIRENKKVIVHVNEIIQVLINIIKNARDIMLEKQISEKILNIKIYSTTNYAVIEIEDNAGGIAPEIIGKVFEPYFSTKENKNGTGLGLYMSKTIIEQHCLGKINVSNSSLGAVFKIELPL